MSSLLNARRGGITALAFAVAVSSFADAQNRKAAAPRPAATAADSTFISALKWREIGPYRGGRSVAVAGSASRPYEYYMGTTGGGVFKTIDGGITWTPTTDKYFGGTIGAIAVSESNPDIVYVGTGESPIRGNVSHGDGVFKSADAGKTWSYVGLRDSRQISRVRVHPTNPDIVYVGAQGQFWGANPERGVFKSLDGGKTWKKILFRNDSTGITDLVMDPSDPNTLYAAFWQSYRTAWRMESGGPGSGIFKTTDAGATWTEITRNPGLPGGLIGNIGVAVSPANPQRVWALVEALDGGVFRSDDAGKTWTKTNEDRKLRQRAWYYSRIYADPKDANSVYALNTGFYRSTDNGKTFKAIPTPHGDSHDLWIAPNEPKRLIEGNDGGANVSFNSGQSWTEQDIATAQFYFVTTTNEFPYQVCGSQQDNSTICIPSRAAGGITMSHWYIGPGCESGYIAVKPDDPDVSFAGCYGGSMEMKNRKTGVDRAVNPWPSNPMGHSSEDIKYRMQWTFPIVYSPHDPNMLYVGSIVLFKTTNGGQSFDIISPDLTRHDPKTMGASGGPITKDQTGVETYATIFTIAESPKEKGTIWTGSDDGYVQITRDAGKTWTNVTPKDLGDFTRVSLIEASPHDAAKAYIAAHRHQFGDLRPTIWRTSDYGKSWTRLGAGIPQDEFVRAVREDPERQGLLYAGTERGVWVSFDDGVRWQSLRNNLPIVPVHSLVVKDGDLVVATHGRSFYILDDLSAMRQATPALARKPAHLFKPRDAYRVSWGGGFGGGDRGPHPAGRNPSDGAVVYYTLAKPNQEVTLDFLDGKGNVLRSFTSRLDNVGIADSVRADSVKKVREDSLKSVGKPIPQAEDAALAAEEQPDFETMMLRGPRPPRVPNKVGLNSFAWNLRHPDAVRFANMIMWAAGTNGPMVAPGTFSVRMKTGGATQAQAFAVKLDPRATSPARDVEELVAFLLKIRDRVSEANNAVRTVRSVRSQLEDRKQRAAGSRKDEFVRAADALAKGMSAAEEEIYQVRNQSSQDPLNYPIKLNNKIAALSGVVSAGDFKPTAQAYVVFEELSGQLGNQLTTLKKELLALDQINAMLKAMNLPIIVPSTDEPSKPKPEIAAEGVGSGK